MVISYISNVNFSKRKFSLRGTQKGEEKCTTSHSSLKLVGEFKSGSVCPSDIERAKSLRHVAMVAKFLDDNKPKRRLKCGFALFQTSSSLLNFI